MSENIVFEYSINLLVLLKGLLVGPMGYHANIRRLHALGIANEGVTLKVTCAIRC